MKPFLTSLMASTAIGATFALSAPAWAQQASTSTNPSVQLPQVVVNGKMPAADDNKTSIGREQLTREGVNKIDDVLRSTAGVFTLQNAQQPGVAVNIRGFEGSGRVNMSIDGVRQNFRFTGHEAGGYAYVDPNLLAGIDVTRGAVTGVGGGALAGTVNLRTLDVDDVLRPGKHVGALARMSWGSNGVGFQEMGSAAARYDGVGVIAAISHRASKNYHDGDGNSVTGTGQDLTSGLFKTEFDLGHGQSLALGAVIYNNDFYADSYFQTVMNKTFTAKYHYNQGNPLVDLRANFSYNALTMKYTGGTGSYVGRNIKDKGVGFDISNVSLVRLGPVNLRSTNGVEYYHDDVSSESGGVNPGNGDSNLLGVFTNNTFSYGIFDLTTGLRYNYYTLNGSGTLSTAYGDYSVDSTHASLDPKITLDANITNWFQPYVTWSRSMRSPSLQETMLGGSHPGTATASFIPNPYLKPETQQGWEFGANFRRNNLLRAQDKFTARADYFFMDVDNYIVGSYVSSQRAYQYQNVAGTSRVSGFELEANYDARVVFGSVSYTHSHSDLPSELPGLGATQYMPDNVVSISAGTRLLNEKLTVGARYNYVSNGQVAGYNSTLTGGVASKSGKPYNLVNLFATAKLTENVDVYGRIDNLFNVNYTPFTNITGNGPGRTFYLGAQVRF